jgi:Leucine-rich repeat (LRR) protein
VLQTSTGLTALDLEHCRVQEAAAAAAAIAALPELQSLRLVLIEDLQGQSLLAVDGTSMAVRTQLTQLSLEFHPLKPVQLAALSELSSLTNLQHLQLTALPRDGVPGGLPSQLVKLTCLDVAYSFTTGYRCDTANQLQHLSSLTALQQLSVAGTHLVTADLSGLQDLSQLRAQARAQAGIVLAPGVQHHQHRQLGLPHSPAEP